MDKCILVSRVSNPLLDSRDVVLSSTDDCKLSWQPKHHDDKAVATSSSDYFVIIDSAGKILINIGKKQEVSKQCFAVDRSVPTRTIAILTELASLVASNSSLSPLFISWIVSHTLVVGCSDGSDSILVCEIQLPDNLFRDGVDNSSAGDRELQVKILGAIQSTCVNPCYRLMPISIRPGQIVVSILMCPIETTSCEFSSTIFFIPFRDRSFSQDSHHLTGLCCQPNEFKVSDTATVVSGAGWIKFSLKDQLLSSESASIDRMELIQKVCGSVEPMILVVLSSGRQIYYTSVVRNLLPESLCYHPELGLDHPVDGMELEKSIKSLKVSIKTYKFEDVLTATAPTLPAQRVTTRDLSPEAAAIATGFDRLLNNICVNDETNRNSDSGKIYDGISCLQEAYSALLKCVPHCRKRLKCLRMQMVTSAAYTDAAVFNLKGSQLFLAPAGNVSSMRRSRVSHEPTFLPPSQLRRYVNLSNRYSLMRENIKSWSVVTNYVPGACPSRRNDSTELDVIKNVVTMNEDIRSVINGFENLEQSVRATERKIIDSIHTGPTRDRCGVPQRGDSVPSLFLHFDAEASLTNLCSTSDAMSIEGDVHGSRNKMRWRNFTERFRTDIVRRSVNGAIPIIMHSNLVGLNANMSLESLVGVENCLSESTSQVVAVSNRQTLSELLANAVNEAKAICKQKLLDRNTAQKVLEKELNALRLAQQEKQRLHELKQKQEQEKLAQARLEKEKEMQAKVEKERQEANERLVRQAAEKAEMAEKASIESKVSNPTPIPTGPIEQTLPPLIQPKAPSLITPTSQSVQPTLFAEASSTLAISREEVVKILTKFYTKANLMDYVKKVDGVVAKHVDTPFALLHKVFAKYGVPFLEIVPSKYHELVKSGGSVPAHAPQQDRQQTGWGQMAGVLDGSSSSAGKVAHSTASPQSTKSQWGAVATNLLNQPMISNSVGNSSFNASAGFVSEMSLRKATTPTVKGTSGGLSTWGQNTGSLLSKQPPMKSAVMNTQQGQGATTPQWGAPVQGRLLLQSGASGALSGMGIGTPAAGALAGMGMQPKLGSGFSGVPSTSLFQK